MKKIKYIAIKEIYHILRDPRSLMIAIAMPIMMTFLYGYAINLDIENTVISIIDYDQTEESREFIGQFYNSTYFTPPEIPADEEDPEQILRTSQADAVLIIRNGFGAAVTKQQPFSLGTNAAPDGSSGGFDGLTAKTNLQGKGITVTTN